MIDYTAATPQTYWYLYNAHGDVVGLADNNGDKVATYEYDVWGNTLNTSSTVNTGDGVALWQANPFRYSGYQYDDETGLYYLKSRYYSPFLGRFITRDAIVALNLYAYASNNPVNFIDPNGYYSVLDTEGNIVLTRSGDIVDQRTGDVKGHYEKGTSSTLTTPDVMLTAAGSVGDAVLGYTIGDMYPKHELVSVSVPAGGGTMTPTIIKGVVHKPWLNPLKTSMKVTGGIVSFGLAGISIIDNYLNYEHSGMRSFIDVSAIALGIGAGLILSSVGAPIIAGIFVAGVIGLGAAYTKNRYFSQPKVR